MNLSLELTNEQSNRLNELANELGVDPHDLARAAINDLLTNPMRILRNKPAIEMRNLLPKLN